MNSIIVHNDKDDMFTKALGLLQGLGQQIRDFIQLIDLEMQEIDYLRKYQIPLSIYSECISQGYSGDSQELVMNLNEVFNTNEGIIADVTITVLSDFSPIYQVQGVPIHDKILDTQKYVAKNNFNQFFDGITL